MSYRTFKSPTSEGWTTVDWRDWAIENGIYIPLKHPQTAACEKCRGAMFADSDWDTCYACNHDDLRGIVPISYSVRSGLESAVYRAKNSADQTWLNTALGSMLSTFLEDHLACIERRFGKIDVFTMLPSHVDARGGWDHMHAVHGGVSGWSQTWDNNLLLKTGASPADDRRKETVGGLFALQTGRDVTGLRVAIVDDTFTSGGTVRSAAKTLVDAGAKRPIAIPIGRQINLAHDISQDLLKDLASQSGARDVGECVVHNRPRMFARL